MTKGIFVCLHKNKGVFLVFYDKFEELCRLKGVTPNKACLDMGLSRSAAAKWRHTGQNPAFQVIAKAAAYFGVPADTLVGNDPVERYVPSDAELKFALFGGEGEITDAMLEEVRSFASFVAAREKKNSEKK